MGGSKGCQELDSSLTVCDVCCVVRQKLVPLVGSPALPFIDQGGSRGYRWEKVEKTKVKKVLRGSRVFLFPYVCPANMVDCVRDGMFADPYRAMPWPPSASGCVPSYTGGWCGVPEIQAVTL